MHMLLGPDGVISYCYAEVFYLFTKSNRGSESGCVDAKARSSTYKSTALSSAKDDMKDKPKSISTFEKKPQLSRRMNESQEDALRSLMGFQPHLAMLDAEVDFVTSCLTS